MLTDEQLCKAPTSRGNLCGRRKGHSGHHILRRVLRDAYEDRDCVECGESFTPKRPMSRFCGRKCMYAHANSERQKVPPWKRHHLTLEQYTAMLEEQDHRCAICRSPLADAWQVAIDHDHKCCPGSSCGKCVRGILCVSCNWLIGNARDDTWVLASAIAYLQGGLEGQ